jgi:dTDP-4-amino-4,6-dideoxygalactose transaminase
MNIKRPKNNPYKIVQMFEDEVANYTGAKFAVSVDSCTNALFLVCKYLEVKEVTIPSKYDAAKRFTSNMYIPNSFMCLSFHIKKHLKISKGGMILTDNEESVKWFKKARYEGRSEKLYHEDDIDMLGWNMYMTPQMASHGLSLMQNMPYVNEDLGENDGYRDLTEFKVFKKYKTIDEQ